MSKKKENNQMKPLAIVGIGCFFPKANNAEEYWANIREGVDAITDIPETHWKPSDYFDENKSAPDMTYGKRGGFINAMDFNPLLYGLSPNNIEATDTTQLLGMMVARQALLDAGYSTGKEVGDGREFDRDRTSVILGITGTLELVIPLGARLGHPIWRKALADAGVDPETTEDVVQRIADGYVPWQENSFPGLLGNVAAGRIANRFDLGGTNCVVDAACASSLSAVHLAALELSAGRVDMAITGGMDTFNDIFMYMCFSKTPALSPTGNSRPFAKEGDGTILGEGLGAVILKRLEDAERDSDKIYAVLKGMGSSSDGKGNAIYAPSAEGQTKALWNAYREADVTPRSIELVEAHGTGTAVGDAVEAKALSGVYSQGNEDKTWCALGSVKSMIGHTKAAAGVAGLIKTAMALKHKVLPPSIKVDEPLEIINPGTAPIYLNSVKRPWLNTLSTPRRAALSAFGFGGSNFHCVLEEAEETKTEIEWDGKILIIGLSADSKSDLINQLPDASVLASSEELRFFAYDSCQVFKADAKYRLTIVVNQTSPDLGKLIADVKQQLNDTSESTWQKLNGVTYSSGKIDNNIAFIFPGQGSQYVGMCRDLACQFPQFSTALEEANQIFIKATGKQSLADVLYPIPVFSKADEKEQENILRQTQNAQPAIGAVSIGVLNVLNHFAVAPTAAIGHSYGELTALSAAGVYNTETLYRLSLIRGELMSAGEGDRGSMLAVVAAFEEVESLLKENNIELIIANHNSPSQVVLSGATEQIDNFAKIAKAEKIRAIKLPVAAAFHSPFVADAVKPFGEALASFEFSENKYQVLSNTSTDAYPIAAEPAKQLLANQLASPVRFVEQIEKLYAEGFNTFIEVGPGKTLTGLVGAILADKEFTAIAIDASAGKQQGQHDLAIALARLATKGVDVDLTKWDARCSGLERSATDAKPPMTVSISGANVMLPRESRPSSKPKKTIINMTEEVKRTSQGAAPVVPQQNKGLLQATKESILALQKMQEQTARLHQQYLEGQEIAQQSIQSLLEQQRLMSGLPLAPVIQEVIEQTAQQQIKLKVPVQEKSVAPSAIEKPIIKEAEGPRAASTEIAEQIDIDINNLLLSVVSEKTGYPLEMLSLDMSLDTDLGIDSIKRVEILSALQEKLPWSAAVNPEELGTFQFLQHIVEFIVAGRPVVEKSTQIAVVAETKQTTPADKHFEKVLLNIVSKKTGYPIEMLDLEMNLDSDLGIDSIKRVEILSALQDAMPNLPMVSPDELGQLQTLSSIIELFISEQTENAPESAILSAPQTKKHDNDFTEKFLEVVADKTGYPTETLNLDMNLDSDLGIDSIKRVEILSAIQELVPELPSVSSDDMSALQTLQQIIDYMNARIGVIAPKTGQVHQVKPSKCRDVKESRLVRSVVHARSLDHAEKRNTIAFNQAKEIWLSKSGGELAKQLAEELKSNGYKTRFVAKNVKPSDKLGALIIFANNQSDKQTLLDAFALMQTCSVSLKKSKGLLVSITTLGGNFGFDSNVQGSADQAGLFGLIKTADKEWDDVSCKSIDIDSDSLSIALLQQEIFLKGPLEIGLVGEQLFQLSLQEETLAQSQSQTEHKLLNEKDCIVISGGARGVTAEMAIKLAGTYQCNLLLLGRSQNPKDEPEWLTTLTEPVMMKKEILNNSGEKLKPADLEMRYQSILANREVRNSLQRIEKTGAMVQYASVDVTDADAVANVIDMARIELGNVTAVIHAAGVLADRLIEDKTAEQFDAVYATKVDGLKNLLSATRNDELKLIVMYSSTTARLGRKGQVDYAAANEILNKIAQSENQIRKDCKVLSINWGPWDGGMVTPALKKLFAAEGVGVIGLNAGADYLIQEIESAGPVETVILGETDNIFTAIPLNKSLPLTERSNLTIAFERNLAVSSNDFLNSHVMNGQAVLPVAVIIEWFAHGALHSNPGMQFHGFDDFRVLKGITLKINENIHLRILAGTMVQQGHLSLVPVELRSDDILYASAVMVLVDDYDENVLPKLKAVKGTYQYQQGEYYKNGQLFHGQHLHGIKVVTHCSGKGIVANVNSAPPPTAWMKQPIRSSWLTDPLILDSAFQMMILWSFEQQGVGSLPTALAHYRQYSRCYPRDGAKVIVDVIEHTNHRANASIEFVDNKGTLIALMEGYECVRDSSLKLAFKENALSIED